MASKERSRSPRRRNRRPLKLEKEQDFRRWLSTVVVNPRGSHTSTLLFLHGFMGDAKSYVEADCGTYWSGEGGLKVILVNAPQRRVTCSRQVTNAWYDYLTDREGELCDVIDREQFDDVVLAVHHLMQKEFNIIGPGNVSIGGYSQGGTIALHAGLTWKGPRLGGIYAISTTLLTTTPALDPGCKIRAFHGLADEVFPWDKWAREGWARLLAAGPNIDLELHVQEGVYHVDDDWEAAVIRKCFVPNGPEEPALKPLKSENLSSAEIESAGILESVLRAARVGTQLMERFKQLLVNIWHDSSAPRDASTRRSYADLREDMKKWHAHNWVQTSLGRRAGGESRFDLLTCEVQGGRESSCRPLPAVEVGKQPVPLEGAVVLSLGVRRAGCVSYLTRTFFCDPSGQQRHVYRTVSELLDAVTHQLLRVGVAVDELRQNCTKLADQFLEKASSHAKDLKRGKFEIYVDRLPVASTADSSSEIVSLEAGSKISEGTHIVTVGFSLGGNAGRLKEKQAPLEPVWLQDTVWVQEHSGGTTLFLTQNSSKEETCVMYTSGEDTTPQDDLTLAVRALSDIQAALDAETDKSALSQQIIKVLQKPEIQELMHRDGGEDDCEGEEEEEEVLEQEHE